MTMLSRQRRQAEGRLASKRGQTSEQRALAACLSLVDEDPRFLSARLATKEEDSAGKDVIVATASGEIGIQVKSSHNDVPDHHLRYPDIPIVVVHRFITDEELAERIGGLIEWELLKAASSTAPGSP